MTYPLFLNNLTKDDTNTFPIKTAIHAISQLVARDGSISERVRSHIVIRTLNKIIFGPHPAISEVLGVRGYVIKIIIHELRLRSTHSRKKYIAESYGN